MDKLYFIPVKEPNNKQLRLALELVDFLYPLFRSLPAETKADALQGMLKISVSKERLKRLNTFKKLVFKHVITIDNNKVKTIRVKRK